MVNKGRWKGGWRQGELHSNTSMTDKDVLYIKARLALEHRQSDIAADYGVSPTTISRIKRGVTWTHVK